MKLLTGLVQLNHGNPAVGIRRQIQQSLTRPVVTIAVHAVLMVIHVVGKLTSHSIHHRQCQTTFMPHQTDCAFFDYSEEHLQILVLHLIFVEVVIQVSKEFHFLSGNVRKVDEEPRAHVLLHFTTIICGTIAARQQMTIFEKASAAYFFRVARVNETSVEMSDGLKIEITGLLPSA
jgi:hypothetical protein